jgi:diaminopimelate decarboxylase
MRDLRSAPVEPPCYVCDLDCLRGRLRAFSEAFLRRFQEVSVAYSYKTNYVPLICRALHAEGALAEVVSLSEYRLARDLGVAPGRIVFNGTGRRIAELGVALAEGARVQLESLDEVRAAVGWSRDHASRPTGIGLRVSVPLPDGPRAGKPSRFGLDVRTGELAAARDLIRQARALTIAGLHAHLSSKTRSLEVFRSLAGSLHSAAAVICEEPLEYLDVGGGFGYLPADSGHGAFPGFGDYADAIAEELSTGPLGKRGLKLVVEPGLALVNDSVSYLAEILSVKRAQPRPVVVIDGGIHAVKPTRHSRNLPATTLSRERVPKDGPRRRYDVVGNTCMEDDYVAVDQELCEAEPGDLLLIRNVGAYTLVFRPPFIHPPPAVYAVSGDQWETARPPASPDDLFHGFLRR